MKDVIGFLNPAFDRSPFRFPAENNVLAEKDLGISGDRVTVLTPPLAACRVDDLQNCPYTASNLRFEVRIDGERIPGRDWVWLPNAIRRAGAAGAFEARSVTLMPPKRNCCLLLITFRNRSDKTVEAPIQLLYHGSGRKEKTWIFPVPRSAGPHFAHAEAKETEGGSILTLTGTADDADGAEIKEDDARLITACSLSGMRWFAAAEIWETERTFRPGEELTVAISLHLGGLDEELTAEAEGFLGAWQTEADRAFSWLDEETARILANLPRFSSDVPELDALYYRSVVTYSLNRFENPNFAVSPFYTTGSVTGGCMCSYLWDYAGGLMLHPLIDPETNKKMIRAYLHADLCTSFAIMPLDGGKTGPWYHINQEKIINMIYYHVLHTGEVSFLDEVVDGKTILEWAFFHACVLDDLSKPVALADYGEAGKSHLELRRAYVYRGVMPDLNARRYENYHKAYLLSEMAGRPAPFLMERAEGLKECLETLWDESDGWYDFIWEGKRDKRYTVQMFKFLESPVIDDAHREKLIAHLNETEFLSKFGLHSMSKTDPAYDQVDIDNGGGGICTLFTMEIVKQLYHTGHAALATDILQRVYWWGTRLPYMGDSCAANMLVDRDDTPLQADISSASCAQTILFGACGISVGTDGSVKICPPDVLPASHIRVEDMRLRGRCFTLEITEKDFTVKTDGKATTLPRGAAYTL